MDAGYVFIDGVRDRQVKQHLMGSKRSFSDGQNKALVLKAGCKSSSHTTREVTGGRGWHPY
jgi:hypothetical protein